MGLSAAQAASQIPSGTVGANSSQTTLAAVALTGTGITGAISYLWSVAIVIPQDASYTNTSAPVGPTLQSTTLTPQGPADYLLSCVATGAFSSNTFTRLVTVTQAYPIVSSSLGPEEEAAPGPYAPTLSDIGGAVGVTWLTTATKISDGSSVSVTGSTTTTPSFTVVAGQAYRVRHRATDAYGRYNDLVVAISTAGIVTMSVAVSQPSNRSTAGAATWTLTPTGGTAPLVYSVGALTRPATSLATITGGTTATPSVTLDKQGRYAFSSTVTDSTGLAVTVNCIVSLVWAPLVPGATPAVQSLAANTTTSGTITFITATGGSGSYTNALTLTKPAGSVAALSASTGLVTTITGMTNGEAYAVTCTSTDADAGSAATCNSGPALVRVATPTIAFSNPVAQAATAAGAASVTFTAATGGTGTLTYGTATLSVPSGSAATLSGSGLGPFTFTTDVPGAYGVTQSVTDTLGVSAQATGVVAYAPVGPTWSVVGALINWTLCTTASRSSAGTLAIYEQDGTTLKATITAAATGSPTGVVGCTNGVGLYSTYTSGAGSLWAVAPIGTPSSASKKIAVQSIVDVSTLSALERAVGASNTLAPVGNTQNFVMFDKPAANYRATVTNRVSNVNATVVALSQASSFGTYLCVTVINDGKQQSVYVNTATSTTDFTPMDALTGGTNIVPRYDSSALGTTPATYSRTYSSVYQAVYAYSAGGATGTAIVTASRLLEATAES